MGKLTEEQFYQLNEDVLQFIYDEDLEGLQSMFETEGADPTYNLCEPLRVSVESGFLDGVKYLSTLKKVHLDMMSGGLVRVAVKSNNNHVLKYLLDQGVDPNLYTKYPSLAEAVRVDNLEAIKILLDFGADLIAENHCALRNIISEEAFEIIARRYSSMDEVVKILANFPLQDSEFQLSETLVRKIEVSKKMDSVFGNQNQVPTKKKAVSSKKGSLMGSHFKVAV